MVSVIELPSTANFSFYFGKVPIHTHPRVHARARARQDEMEFVSDVVSRARSFRPIRESPAVPFLGSRRPRGRRKLGYYVIVSSRCHLVLAALAATAGEPVLPGH